jgi:hypothetical protein
VWRQTCPAVSRLAVCQRSCDPTPVAGLSLAGGLLESVGKPFKRIDRTAPVHGVGGISTRDAVRSCTRLRAQDQADADASLTRAFERPVLAQRLKQ